MCTEPLAQKAATNYRAARYLVGQGYLDAAANRAYYALYQAVLRKLKSLGKKPSEVSSTCGDNWNHSAVRGNLGLAGLRRPQKEFFFVLQDLRMKADYQDDPVEADEIAESVLTELAHLLTHLKVRLR